MSTTRFWGELDDGDKVRRAVEGEIGGNEWSEGSKFRGTPPSSVYKKNDRVNGKWMAG